ncbi:nibrin [Pieris brassicae]|uniref:nibrin n=1 Tax=Pieris brassicae TaxID=7116 RepID=UPI001E6612DD|nr:nibrin [Pieris brassicae]
MWFLTSNSESRLIYVNENKNVTIGRSIDAQNSNFAVPDDPSLSRKHATLSVKDGELVLRDLGSKYGTYINNNIEKVVSEVDHILNSGDVVKFGKMNCIWKVNQLHFITCTSTLKGENLQTLKVHIMKLGGELKSNWDDTCYYLTMPAITLTIKVVLALVQGSHIVTTEYWKKCLEAVNTNGPLPSPNDFVPQIVETTLNKEIVSFLPNDQRHQLFGGKSFVFFSKRQMEMYEVVLLKSSAKPLLLSECKMSKSGLCEPNVIVIQYNITSTSQESQAQKEQINNIVGFLKNKGKRLIPDPEIGLAILYCSTKKYCNPDFNFTSEVIKHAPGGAVKSNKILAPETQESTQNSHKKENVVINESLNSKNDTVFEISKRKRKLSVENDDNISNKKIHAHSVSSCDGKKRVAEEDLSNSSKKIALNSNDDDDDGIFNFVTNETNKNTDKKLNLAKPSKRKMASEDDDDDDPFNFVEKKKPCTETNLINEKELISETNIVKVDNVKVEEMRGTKLQELMERNSNLVNTRTIKKEDISDLDEKFHKIDIGSTTIIVRNDLIIKREPIEIKPIVGEVKNFKKFKKVWPPKMQVSIIS